MPADSADGRERLGPAARDVALEALLRRHPEAWVVAIKPSGHFTDMPDNVELDGQKVIQGPMSALELVVPEDRPIVIDTWGRAISEGGANATVHPYSNASRRIGMHFLDLTHRYGVYIGLFIGFLNEDGPDAADPSDLVPRTAIVRKDQVAAILAVDKAATAILGWSAEEMVGKRMLEFVHPEDHERAIANWMDMLSRPDSSQRVRLRHHHRDGSWIWLEVTNHNRLGDPEDQCVLADMVDVNDEVTALEALRANEQLLRRLTEALPVGVLHIGRDATVTYANERLADIVGVGWASTVEEQFATAVPDDRAALNEAVQAALERGRDSDLSVSFAPKADTRVHCDLNLRALVNESGTVVGAIVCVTDTTADNNLREELRHRARYDQLTGCLNHAAIMSELTEWLAHPTRELTLALFIDLDNFKDINDQHGHAAGDQVLRFVADRLHDVARDDDLVGRLGGDEFLVIMGTADDPRALNRIVDRVAEALDQAIAWENGWLSLRASIGVAFTRSGSQISADALVSAADTAMYVSKRNNGSPTLAETP